MWLKLRIIVFFLIILGERPSKCIKYRMKINVKRASYLSTCYIWLEQVQPDFSDCQLSMLTLQDSERIVIIAISIPEIWDISLLMCLIIDLFYIIHSVYIVSVIRPLKDARVESQQ